MTSEELRLIITTTPLKSLNFDGYEFKLEFEDNLIVTVGKTTEWDSAVWEIDSNVEEAKRIAEYEKRMEIEKAIKKENEERKQKLLAGLSEKQRKELLGLLGNKF